jgi:hypothetical protein
MSHQSVEFQAKMYVYDLNNCAKEFGFKPDENWELSLASASEASDIAKKYHPTITTKVLPEILGELMRVVKIKLIEAKAGFERKFDSGDNATGRDLQYLVAFNPKRVRP